MFDSRAASLAMTSGGRQEAKAEKESIGDYICDENKGDVVARWEIFPYPVSGSIIK